jgi:PEP-CTERM motif
MGANVYVPTYIFEGYTTWGEAYPLFIREENDEMLKITTSSSDYLIADMPSLIYMEDTNTFYGIMTSLIQEESGSLFIDDLQNMFSDSWYIDPSSYIMMEITPDINLLANTNNFSIDSLENIGFSNSIGFQRVPEPSSLLLMLIGMLGVSLCIRNRN